MGYPPARSEWGIPEMEMEMEYLIHHGRYASWVHAGGLSCCTCEIEDSDIILFSSTGIEFAFSMKKLSCSKQVAADMIQCV